MKAIAFSGSPRKNGNTDILARHTLKAIEEEGLDTELIRVADLDIQPCNACKVCKTEETCPIKDGLMPLYNKMKEADAIIFATPVYFGSATPQIKALMDRAGYIAYWHRTFERKVGGPLVVGGRSGHNFTVAQIAYWYFILGCIVPGSIDWNVAFGNEKGEVEKDEAGLETAQIFGKNVAWLVKKLKS